MGRGTIFTIFVDVMMEAIWKVKWGYLTNYIEIRKVPEGFLRPQVGTLKPECPSAHSIRISPYSEAFLADVIINHECPYTDSRVNIFWIMIQ